MAEKLPMKSKIPTKPNLAGQAASLPGKPTATGPTWNEEGSTNLLEKARAIFWGYEKVACLGLDKGVGGLKSHV
jgi:hypothetical protein